MVHRRLGVLAGVLEMTDTIAVIVGEMRASAAHWWKLAEQGRRDREIGEACAFEACAEAMEEQADRLLAALGDVEKDARSQLDHAVQTNQVLNREIAMADALIRDMFAEMSERNPLHAQANAWLNRGW
jgi:hypothetical protein